MPSDPLPAANSRRRFCFRWLREIRGALASSVLGSPAAAAQLGVRRQREA